ncbi:Uncharacterised protein [Weissella viridescens]|uniref:Uncharacterized protein n=1 Tax=Weissella viridescens TaxID=1629 RepID=A0A380P6U6_WEIVI|nr:Uncharacterised protein [Weissella viridescens]
MIKLIAIDIDDTLVNTKKKLRNMLKNPYKKLAQLALKLF